MKYKLTRLSIGALILCSVILSSNVNAQILVNRDTMLAAALEIMKETSYCGLVTVDSTGQPQVRTMNPFPANEELITWVATSRTSRKVKEIRENPKVCVYYANHLSAKGYVNITGIAEIIDKELLIKMKRDYWSGIPDWQNIFVLIRIKPQSVEVINCKHSVNGDPNTFKAPTIDL